MKILVIDDIAEMRRFVALVLREDGHVVDAAETATDGLLVAQAGDYDAIVLDIVLPDGDGLAVLRALRRAGSSTPIILLTGMHQHDDIVRGLDAGADDYLAKPFVAEVLKARIRALVRRGGAVRSDSHTAGNVVLNRLTREARVAGKRLELTPKEYHLLEHFLLHADQVVTRSAILAHVWERNRDPDSNVIDALVVRLRTKLRTAGATLSIETSRGFGFRLAIDRPRGD